MDKKPANWKLIKAACRDVVEVGEVAVAHLKSMVRDTEVSPPYHLVAILHQLKILETETGIPRHQITILDHGCGGGLTLMYLAALGYRNVFGIEVGSGTEQIDCALKQIIGSEERRVLHYDGYRIPFPDGYFHLIFSQQVMEHVEDELIHPYIEEEGRVLSELGIVYHQIPHRWTPWESHTKTWCIHYLPRNLRRRAYALLGQDPDYVEKILYLRSPLFLFRKFNDIFHSVRNENLYRLQLVPDPSYYDGNIRLRNIVSGAAKLPLVRGIIKNFVMIDLIAKRPYQDN